MQRLICPYWIVITAFLLQFAAKCSAFHHYSSPRLLPQLRVSVGDESPSPGILNEEQLAAVTAPVCHVLVRAGPGSGKTRVLIYRIVHLLQEEGISAKHILAVTFTRKAAMEMKERIGALVEGDTFKQLTVCTLHSFCCMLLRRSYSFIDESEDGAELLQKLGGTSNNLDQSFSVYDGDDSKKAIKSILVSQGFDLEEVSPGKVQECISLLKRDGFASRFMDGDAGMQSAQSQSAKNITDTAKLEGLDLDSTVLECSLQILPLYTQLLQLSNARDFDDLIADTLKLLQSNNKASIWIKNCYQHILVDEWQDIDRSQYALLTMLVDAEGRKRFSKFGTLQQEKSLYVVGDPQQTIYSWRGADPLNMEKLMEHFPSCVSFDLVRNYRSVKGIVSAARGVIEKGAGGVTKSSSPDFTAPSPRDSNLHQDKSPELQPQGDDSVQAVNTYKDEPQANFVAHMVEYLRSANSPLCSNGVKPSIAILYRKHSLSEPIESALILRKIPYSIFGGPGLMGRKSVKDLMSYVKLLVNPCDTEALKRTINFPPRGVGTATQDAFFEMTLRVGRPVLEMLMELGEGVDEPEKKKSDKIKKKSKDDPGDLNAGDEKGDGAHLTARQIKALKGAGQVFTRLRQLTNEWTGSIDSLLEDILEISGLKQRARELLETDDKEKEADLKLKGQKKAKISRSDVTGLTPELRQLLQLAKEFEKDIPSALSMSVPNSEGEEARASSAGKLEGSHDNGAPSTDKSESAIEKIQLFLDMLQLHAKEEEEFVESGSVNQDKVKLMTLHASKGLEFDCVMIIGLEENCLPGKEFRGAISRNALSNKDTGDDAVGVENVPANDVTDADAESRYIEEERRLLYVGMTRAKKKLFLMYRSRMSLGDDGRSQPLRPSRFLQDLPLDVDFVRAN